ncbi:MFS transporter [Amycolatopsis sp. NBC_01488]|uniref:MFS transporter n=1 Tax=Amycolatopsis sp. NBC_01488 TaxID=2903563 RepID=UPI002E2AB432|nr:MFS transporter [Amycolatopsis sp. NBC_01488]
MSEPGTTERTPTIGDLFREPRARTYFLGVGVSLFGDNVLTLAAGVWAKTLTGNDGAGGLVSFFLLLPTLCSPVFGVLADRVRKRSLMIAVNAVMVLIVPTLLFVRTSRDIWLIYLVMLASGVAVVTLAAAQSGLFVMMLPERLLGTANSTYTSMQEGMKVLAPAAGAALFVWLGGGLIGLLDGLTFLVACAVLWAIKVPEPAPQPRRAKLRAELTEGFRHLAKVTELRVVVGAAAVIMLTAGFVTTALFGVVSTGLGRAPAFLGVVSSMQGIGSVVGGLLAPRLIAKVGEARTVGFAAVLTAAGTAVLAVPSVAVVLPGNALRGVGLAWMLIGAITLMQRRTPGALMGRAASALYMLLFGPSVLALLTGAGLTNLTGHRTLVVVAAVLAAGAGAVVLIRRSGPVRTSTEEES